MKKGLLSLLVITVLSCSKSGGPSSGAPYNNGTGLVPLAVNDQWNYKLKNYNTTTGAVTDSTTFTLTVSSSKVLNGVTYFQLVNSLNNSSLWLTNLSGTSIGSIDTVGGSTPYTFFVNGTGDSTQSISSWAASAGSCTGTEKLYAYYADTTLVDFGGQVWTDAIKNDAVIYDCSGDKYVAQVYFIKAGVGLVRYAQYIYNGAGQRFLQLAWILESSD
jgi:hypothetical protein